jgi:hypothetical protein
LTTERGRQNVRERRVESGRSTADGQIVPPHEVLEVAPSRLEQLFTLDIISVGRTGRAGEEREIGDELPEPQFGGVIAELRQDTEQFVPDGPIHGSVLPMVVRWRIEPSVPHRDTRASE